MIKNYAVMILAVLWTASASAGFSVSVIPDNPTPETPLQVRIEGALLCGDPPPFLGAVEQMGNTVTVRFWSDDGCGPAPPLPEYLYDIGTLPAGSYTFQFFSCADLPLPLGPSCDLVSTQPLLVAGGVAARAVPMLSPVALAAMGMLFVGFGLVARRWQ